MSEMQEWNFFNLLGDIIFVVVMVVLLAGLFRGIWLVGRAAVLMIQFPALRYRSAVVRLDRTVDEDETVWLIEKNGCSHLEGSNGGSFCLRHGCGTGQPCHRPRCPHCSRGLARP